MVQTGTCAKCSGAMDEGFVVDAAYGAMAVASWVEGAPRRSLWTGVKLSGRRRSQIAAWRCTRCGFVEHYAPAVPDLSQEAAERKQVLLALAISVGLLLLLLGGAALLRME
jgi:hypothetical protein